MLHIKGNVGCSSVVCSEDQQAKNLIDIWGQGKESNHGSQEKANTQETPRRTGASPVIPNNFPSLRGTYNNKNTRKEGLRFGGGILEVAPSDYPITYVDQDTLEFNEEPNMKDETLYRGPK